MKARSISISIEQISKSSLGRIIIFTGARQTGKSTLSKHLFPDYRYISVEDPILRGTYAELSAAQWAQHFPLSIIDEVQKLPQIIESIKAVYDEWEAPRYILLGSSQLLLLEKVKESLAGRCSIVELFPLTAPELRTHSWDDPPNESPYQKILKNPQNRTAFLPDFRLDPDMHAKSQAWTHLQDFGGYPALTNPEFNSLDKQRWLSNYVRTYLERDVRDLAAFRDLLAFAKLQQYLAAHSANLINAAGIASQVGVSSKTVQRYLQYLELSYQGLLLPAWSKNISKRLSKAAKFHFLDRGIQQAANLHFGPATGHEFESLVVAELFKQAKILGIPARFFHFRTADGREVDLLIELAAGYLAFEIKLADTADFRAARHLQNLGEILDKPLLHSFVLSKDKKTREISPGIQAVHVAYFLA